MATEYPNPFGHDAVMLAGVREAVFRLLTLVPELDLREPLERMWARVMTLPPDEARERVQTLGDAFTRYGRSRRGEDRDAARRQLLALLDSDQN